MANYIDYLNWRGDVPFDFDDFCEADGLVMAQFSYLPLEGIMEEGFALEKTVEEIGKAFFEKYSEKDFEEGTALFRHSRDILQAMMQAPRYKNVRVTNYRMEYNPELAMQFGAVTLEFKKDTCYVAFRGTDDTLAGWQEDFKLCYTMPVASQVEAERYLQETMKQLRGKKFIVGGHSKGGNLAMYASMRMEKKYKDRILGIYNYDGPGFMEDVVQEECYLDIMDKIHSFMPHESIVGMILYHDSAYKIVNCTERGIAQHTASTWQIYGRAFETQADFKNTSMIFNTAVRKWIGGISDEEREFFVSLVFSILEEGGETFSDLMANPKSTLLTLLQTYHGKDKETKRMVHSILKQLVVLGTQSVKENILKDNKEEATV